jgi:hypothetical protein
MFILRIRQTQNYLCRKNSEILLLRLLVRHTTTRLGRFRNIPVMYFVEDSVGMKWRRVTLDSLPGATLFRENKPEEISLH